MHPQFRVGCQVGHLAHRSTRTQRGHQRAIAQHLHLTLRDDVKTVATVAALEQRMAVAVTGPGGAVHHFPQLDVAKAAEKLQRAQQREALGVQHLLQTHPRHLTA